MNELIKVKGLKEMMSDPDVLVFDCRFNLLQPEAGHADYLQKHIAGALYADLNKDLSSPHIAGKTGRHPLPDRSMWIAKVQHWGISPDKLVVAYDDAGGAFAARLWWLLRWIGHERVGVLDGGWQAWLANQGQTDGGEQSSQPTSDYDYATCESLCSEVTVQDVDASEYQLVDAREMVRFRGEYEPIDPVAGHIPGAMCSPMSGNLEKNGFFKKAAELQEKFAGLERSGKPLLCYCGSGVTATHNILALRIAGFEEPALYAGSWSEWITDPLRPVARGQ
jgi:thiosulfate/3-mercaptopyruvate sulfurtransferase